MNGHMRVDSTGGAEHQSIGVGIIHEGFGLILP